MSSGAQARKGWASILVGAGVVGLVGYLTLSQSYGPPRRDAMGADGGAPALDAGVVATPASDGGAESAALTHAPGDPLDASVPSPLTFDLATPRAEDAALPASGPRTVRVGVVLVQWQGAEGATTSTRSKKDALARAQELASEARSDFRRAVAQGDPGSAEDIGRIPRGTLEPRAEAAVFALEKGDVTDVVETPRGYWIVKRID